MYSSHPRSKVSKSERTISSSGNGISDSRMHIVIVHGDTALHVLRIGGVEGWHQSRSHGHQQGSSHHAIAASRTPTNKLAHVHQHTDEHGFWERRDRACAGSHK
jgi:hypothetical protein